MKPEELYELRIGGKVTQKELAAHLSVDRRIAGKSSSPTSLLSRSSGLAYVNLHKVPMTGISIAESLIMRNLIRFLRSGMSRLMGKNTPKGRQYYLLSDATLKPRFSAFVIKSAVLGALPGLPLLGANRNG